MTDFGGLQADAVEMGLVSLRFIEERQVGGCWCSSRCIRSRQQPAWGVRLHDLRHGFASFAVAAGDSLCLVGKVLGHTQAATTQRYAHLQLDPVRAVAGRTARKLAGALAGSADSAKVVELGEHRRAK